MDIDMNRSIYDVLTESIVSTGRKGHFLVRREYQLGVFIKVMDDAVREFGIHYTMFLYEYDVCDDTPVVRVEFDVAAISSPEKDIIKNRFASLGFSSEWTSRTDPLDGRCTLTVLHEIKDKSIVSELREIAWMI